MEVNREKVRMFVLSFNHPFKKIIGEILDDSTESLDVLDGDVLTVISETNIIKVRFPVLCEEMYSSDGKSGTAYLSSIPSMDDTLEFNRSQVLILPFKPTDEYMSTYMDMAKRLNYPMLRKVTRSLEIGVKL